MTVHALHEGRALCGKPGTPGDWQDGDRWQGAHEWKVARALVPNFELCGECDRLASERLGMKPSGRHERAPLHDEAIRTAAAAARIAARLHDSADSLKQYPIRTKLQRRVRELLKQLAAVVPEELR
jgi:hypothetical protein